MLWGPGVYDIHSPRIPNKEEIVKLLKNAARVLDKKRIWVNPDCGLKQDLGKKLNLLLKIWWQLQRNSRKMTHNLTENIIKPKPIKIGSTAGIFTASSPAHIWFKEKYLHAIEQLNQNGFQVCEGNLTKQFKSQSYRTAPPKERAAEFMGLIENEK